MTKKSVKRERTCVQFTAAAASVVLIASVPSAAMASENGNNAYPIGLNTLVTGIEPPAGDHFYNYTLYYDADQISNADGKPAIPNFRAESIVSAFRIIHTFDTTIAGLHPSLEAVVPVAHISVTNPAGHFETTNLSDINLGFILARHSPKFHDYVEAKIFVPSGSYNSTRALNAGRGYTSMAFFYGATYLPVKTVDVGVLIAYTHNLENPSTSYKSGEEVTTEFSTNWQLQKGLFVGLGGYYYQQVTDDTVRDVKYRDGYRGMAVAAGPQIRTSFGRVSVGAKWQHEFRTENRPRGERLWLQFYIPLSGKAAARPATFATPLPPR